MPSRAMRHKTLSHPVACPVSVYQKCRLIETCLLYTSDAADERSSVDLGGRRIIKNKKTVKGGAQSEQ